MYAGSKMRYTKPIMIMVLKEMIWGLGPAGFKLQVLGFGGFWVYDFCSISRRTFNSMPPMTAASAVF